VIEAKSILFPILSILCWIAFVYKLRDLRISRSDPALLALLSAFAFKGTAFILATPAFGAAVDQWAAIPDVAALGIHLLGGVAFGFSVLIVVVVWTHSPRKALVKLRWRLSIAVLISSVMFLLWLLTVDGSGHRSTHYLVENSQKPTVILYTSLYVSTLMVALVEIIVLCVKYARATTCTGLHRGLLMTAFGSAVYSVNFLNRATTPVATRLGLNPLDWEIVVPLCLGVGIPSMVAGLTMPSWGPRVQSLCTWWRSYVAYRRLYPLWAALYEQIPDIALHAPSTSLTNLNYRLYRRVIEIMDGLLILRPFKDSNLAFHSEKRCVEAGMGGVELRAVVEAAQLRVALDDRFQGVGR
jgi:hypothetical protein